MSDGTARPGGVFFQVDWKKPPRKLDVAFDPATQAAYLVTGKLSLAALAELLQRTKAGEDGNRVRVELLLREGKAVEST